MSGQRCSYFLCNNSTKNTPGFRKFFFPIRDPDRCEKWIANSVLSASIGVMEEFSSTSIDVKVDKNIEQHYAAYRYAECKVCDSITNFVRPLKLTLEEHNLLPTVSKLFPRINLDAADNSMICDSCLTSLMEADYQNNKLLTTHYGIIDIDKKEMVPVGDDNQFGIVPDEILENSIKTEELQIKDEKEIICLSDDDDGKNDKAIADDQTNMQIFPCEHCDYVTQRWHALQRHTLYIHKKNGELFQCDQCKYKTYNKMYLETHKVRHLGKYRYSCEYCDTGFDSKLSVQNHILNSHPEMDHLVSKSKILQCEYCEYRSVFNSKMYLHKLKHTKNHAQPLRCSNCKFFTYNKHTLRLHMWTHTKSNKPFVCKICKKDFVEKYKLDGHLLSKHSDNAELIATITSKIHYCNECPYKCVRLAHFQRHEQTHQQFICQVCKKYFVQKYNLEDHMLNNHGDNAELIARITRKIHCCKKCPYRSVKSIHFRKHVKTHKNKTVN